MLPVEGAAPDHPALEAGVACIPPVPNMLFVWGAAGWLDEEEPQLIPEAGDELNATTMSRLHR